ncbi:hypothetical protein QTP88_005119 [Uroleucon formosanum]
MCAFILCITVYTNGKDGLNKKKYKHLFDDHDMDLKIFHCDHSPCHFDRCGIVAVVDDRNRSLAEAATSILLLYL